jgi:hypothetical protein
MSQKLFYFCNIIAESEEDFQVLSEHFGNYPVSIKKEFPDEMYFEVPTLVVGWNATKNRFPSQNIFDKGICKNLYWSFSKSEKEKEFYSEAESFFTNSVKQWLPNNFVVYDSFLSQESLEVFLSKHIAKEKKVFIYFSEGALYIHNNGNNFSINVKALAMETADFKAAISKVLNGFEVVCFSFQNIYRYVNLDLLEQVISIDTLRWVKYGVETLESYFQIIPNFKIQKFIPFLMSKLGAIELDFDEQKFYKRMCERDKITCWLSEREIAFAPDFENTKLDFKIRRTHKLAKVLQSDKRTITGRIMSSGGYNLQTLDKETDERTKLISRFEGGSIVVFDYISFESKIALYLSDDQDFIQKHYTEDLHHLTALELFGNSNITHEQRAFSKHLNHTLLYGAGEETLLKMLSEFFVNPEEQLYKIRKLLKPIIDKSEEIKNRCKAYGYIILGDILFVQKNYSPALTTTCRLMRLK